MVRSARIISNELVSTDTRRLRIDATPPFSPGMIVGLQIDPAEPERLYSIASGQGDPWIDVLYTRVEDGLLTPRLWERFSDSTILMSPPRGQFLDQPTSRSLWIANGTGVAPFLSMAKSGYGGRSALIHGVRVESNLYGRSDFAKVPGLQYIPCVTQPKSVGFAGRLTEWLRTNGAELVSDYERFMLCGSAGMIVEVREILMGLGIAHDRIVSEIYF